MRHASKSRNGRSAWFLMLAAFLPWSPSQARSPDEGLSRPDRVTVATQATRTDDPKGRNDSKEVQGQGTKTKTKKPDVIFVPTPQVVVDKMLEMAEVKKGDILFDLGCGDGRIVVTAAKKFGVKATGIDIDPQRIKEARENVANHGVEKHVTIRHADIFETDLSDADVVTLYLLPELNVRLMPQLRKLKPGARIVSHDFDMRGAKPKKVVTLQTDDEEEEHTVYLWVVPWEKDES